MTIFPDNTFTQNRFYVAVSPTSSPLTPGATSSLASFTAVFNQSDPSNVFAITDFSASGGGTGAFYGSSWNGSIASLPSGTVYPGSGGSGTGTGGTGGSGTGSGGGSGTGTGGSTTSGTVGAASASMVDSMFQAGSANNLGTVVLGVGVAGASIAALYAAFRKIQGATSIFGGK